MWEERELEILKNKLPPLSERKQEEILLKIRKITQKRKENRFNYIPIIAICMAMLLMTVISISFFMAENNSKQRKAIDASETLVKDTNTLSEIKVVDKLSQGMFTYDYKYDGMDRGKHDYSAYPLVIAPLNNTKNISRGEVVFFDDINFEGNKSKNISRVVGLKGESVKIVNGQVYINGKKLATFYGSAHRLGWNKDQYFKFMNKRNYDKKGMELLFTMNMKEIKLADNEYFLISDDWLRGKMLRIKDSKIIGEVLGYEKEN